MRASRAWLASLLLLAATGCSAGAQEAPEPLDLPERSAPAGVDESLRDEALALVEAREDALRSGDRDGFLATVDPGDLGFSSRQARWFDNLAKLPVDKVSYVLGDEDVMTQVTGEGDLQLPVDFTMRLRGFDRRPVTQQMVWTFVRVDGEVLLANDRNVRIEAKTGWTPAPWDLTRIVVRRSKGILGIFDEDTEVHADYVMSDLATAAEQVRVHLPEWSGTFVVYGINDVSALDEMSYMTVDNTAGVAFPVLSREGGPVAAYRFLVNPDVVPDVVSRSWVFRHELVHVALGTRDDRSPRWLVEGAAEYVARSTFPEYQRRLMSAQELTAVRTPRLESSARFYQRNPTRNYALAALVCDYLASTRGEQVLWDLIDTFRTADISLWAEAEDVVASELGLTPHELATQALAWARSA